MRLTYLKLEGFRGFARSCDINLDGDVVLFVGPNGQGKTSVFDGILWCLTGAIPRLHTGDDTKLLSLYSDSGFARAELGIRDSEHSWSIVRSSDGSTQRTIVRTETSELLGAEATAYVGERVFPAAKDAFQDRLGAAAAVTRSIYLQQDLVRQFIEAEWSERFDVITELIGTSAYSDVQREVEKQRKAWSEALNRLIKERDDKRAYVQALQARLSQAPDVDASGFTQLQNEWSAWSSDAVRLGVTAQPPPRPEGPSASSFLDAATRELLAIRRNIERRLQIFGDLVRLLKAKPKEPTEFEALAKDAKSAEASVVEAREQLEKLQAAAARQRRELVESRKASDEMRSLAQLALRHLGDHCPVCAQTYDRPTTVKRLNGLLSDPEATTEPEPYGPLVDVAAQRVASEEERLAELQKRVGVARLVQNQFLHWQSELKRITSDLRLQDAAADSMEQAVRAEVDVLRARLDQIQEAVNRGESIALRVARRAQQGQREELQRELDRVNRDIFQQDADIELRTQTRDASSQVIEALKEAATDAVIKRLEHVRPLMQKIYSRIDPHPSFRHVDLIAESFRNRGQMSLHLSDAETNRRVDEPKFYLSSSQLNALSVVMFLGMNLGLSQAALNTMILDDPLQSLDDINLLGLIDLLRRVKQRRQLLISTHDRKFAALLAKKLRPVGEGQVSRVVRLGEWHRGNPEVHQHEVAVDEPRLRTVA